MSKAIFKPELQWKELLSWWKDHLRSLLIPNAFCQSLLGWQRSMWTRLYPCNSLNLNHMYLNMNPQKTSTRKMKGVSLELFRLLYLTSSSPSSRWQLVPPVRVFSLSLPTRGYTLKRLPVYHKAKRQASCSLLWTNLELPISLMCVHLDGGRKHGEHLSM